MSQPYDGSKLDLERELIRVMAERRITRRQLLERISAVGATVALAPIVAACARPGSQPASAPASAATPAPTSAPASGAASPSEAVATPEPTPVPSPESELYIYNWDYYIGEDTKAAFEKQYGIRVKYDKFPDADTQITKIRSDGKGGGYDITYPASTDIPSLSRDGIIRPLDHSLLKNVGNLGTEWQNPAYDPGNANSVPYVWWTTGFVWDTKKINEDFTSWAALWDERFKGHLGMLDDKQETFAAGAFRLGLDPNTTNEADLDAILALLKQQKPLLRKYTSDDIADVLSGSLWMTHAWSGDYYQMTFDKPSVQYTIPTEGAIRGSDTMVVLSGAKHPIAAHLWIDFNLDAKVSAANSNYMGYMGPNAAALEFIDEAISGNPALNPTQSVFGALTELITLEGEALDAYTRRWNELKA
jgi:spermidine/putrescine transport system substrate-binding protein